MLDIDYSDYDAYDEAMQECAWTQSADWDSLDEDERERLIDLHYQLTGGYDVD